MRILVYMVLAALALTRAAPAMDTDPSAVAAPYDHDRFQTAPRDILRRFRAFWVSFDSDDDDDGDGIADRLGQPQWMAQEIRRSGARCISAPPRPAWRSDPGLVAAGIAPKPRAYRKSAAFRRRFPDWYERGHLAARFLTARLGAAAARESQTLLNAVPQRPTLNRGLWARLERRTAAWAQRFGRLWVVAGPIFARPAAPLSPGGPALPTALFKVVIRPGHPLEPDRVLAFLFPQDPNARPTDTLAGYLTSIDRIETLSGLDLLSALPAARQATLESRPARTIWAVADRDRLPACR